MSENLKQEIMRELTAWDRRFDLADTIADSIMEIFRKGKDENQFYGWYDDADQPRDKPTYEPPRDAACPYCGKPINPDDVRTHSLMYAGGLR